MFWDKYTKIYVLQILVYGELSGSPSNTDFVRINYLLVTCGLTPCLYFLGIAENRDRNLGKMILKMKMILGYA